MIGMALDRVDINDAEIAKLMRAENGDVAKHIRQLGHETAVLAAAKAGKRTGRLRRSIKMRRDPAGSILGYAVLVGSDVSYSWVHHDGARRHIIRARGNGMLAFRGRRGMVFTRQVVHPGTRPNKYLMDALEAVVR
jgi:hypothetical protein